MSKTLLTALLLVLLSNNIQAQYFEVGIVLGAANYFGDVQNGEIKTSEYHPTIGMRGRYNLSKHLSVGGHLLQGRISGADRNATRVVDQERNLSFRSDIIEVGLTGELYLSAFNIPADKRSAPYLFGGVSVFHFQPKTLYNGDWINLRPIGTEGQGRADYEAPYSLVSVAVPFGLGLKFALNNRMNISLSLGLRYTFTDYLDDVSGLYPNIALLRETDPRAADLSFRTSERFGNLLPNPVGMPRGDASNNDWYFIGGLTISFNLTNKYGLDFDQRYAPFKKGGKYVPKPKEVDVFE